MPNQNLSKTEYILSLPHLSAQEVVARVTAAGYAVTVAQVYALRAYQRKKMARLATGAPVPWQPLSRGLTPIPAGPAGGASLHERIAPLKATFAWRLAKVVESAIEHRVRVLIEERVRASGARPGGPVSARPWRP